jgi:outer membrane protein assembly factor BamD (BamD/ComL family)
MLKNNKKLIKLIVTIAVAVVVLVGATFVVMNIVNNNSKHENAVTKTTADSLKSQAITEIKKDNTAKAKTLFQKAKQQYEQLGDKNDVVDIDAQLYAIEHSNNKK